MQCDLNRALADPSTPHLFPTRVVGFQAMKADALLSCFAISGFQEGHSELLQMMSRPPRQLIEFEERQA